MFPVSRNFETLQFSKQFSKKIEDIPAFYHNFEVLYDSKATRFFYEQLRILVRSQAADFLAKIWILSCLVVV